MRRVEVDHISSLCLDWLAYDKTSTLKAVISMISPIETLQRDVIVNLKLLIFRVLDDEVGRDRAFIDKRERALLLSVDFRKFKVDHRFKQLDDGASKVRLDRETHGRPVLYLNIETGNGFAALFATNLNLKVKLVL